MEQHRGTLRQSVSRVLGHFTLEYLPEDPKLASGSMSLVLARGADLSIHGCPHRCVANPTPSVCTRVTPSGRY